MGPSASDLRLIVGGSWRRAVGRRLFQAGSGLAQQIVLQEVKEALARPLRTQALRLGVPEKPPDRDGVWKGLVELLLLDFRSQRMGGTVRRIAISGEVFVEPNDRRLLAELAILLQQLLALRP